MKTILIYIFTIIPLFSLGQKSNTVFNTGSNNFLNWTYSDFLTTGIKKIEGYSYVIKKNGKIKKGDSLLLFQKIIDLDSNMVFGINSSVNYQSHGPTFLSWFRFNEYYDSQGNLIRYIDKPKEIQKRKEYGDIVWDININETILDYDNNLLTKETYNRIEHSYWVWKRYKDTSYYHSVEPKIYEYKYDVNGNEIKKYFTRGKIVYLHPKDFDPNKDSTEVDQRYLSGEKEYDNNENLIKWVWYTRKNDIHSKKYYSYDDKNRLIKQIDSTGSYEPYWESTTTYRYSDSTTIKTQINNTKARFGSSTPKTVTIFDTNDRLISSCSYSDSTESCTIYSYRIDKEKLTEIRIEYPDGRQRIEKFTFNDDGLLIEERHFLEDKMVTLIRYYYEK